MAATADYYDHSNPTTALSLSQRAQSSLSKVSLVKFPMSILSHAESPEEWAEIEQTFYACLRVGDDKTAHMCVEKLSQRFGAGNERVLAMRGMYHEAIAEDDEALKKVLIEYNTILKDNPMNVAIHKRRVALIRSLGNLQEATSALVQFLDSFPTDTEAWCELSDLYQSQGLFPQAIYSLEEALLTVPNAWNLHARLGELNYIACRSGCEGSPQQYIEDAIRRFSRSIELCDDYLRGYYGLKKSCALALTTLSKSSSFSTETVQKLNMLATEKLQVIVKQWSVQQQRNTSVEAEVIAAQALLNGS